MSLLSSFFSLRFASVHVVHPLRRHISLFIFCLDYVLRTSIDLMKENCFKLAKERSRKYPTQTITYAGYTDDIALLANTPAQAQTLLHRLEQAAGGIGPHSNADKTVYTCFNQRGSISRLNGGPLKLVDKSPTLEEGVSSTVKDSNMRLAKA